MCIMPRYMYIPTTILLLLLWSTFDAYAKCAISKQRVAFYIVIMHRLFGQHICKFLETAFKQMHMCYYYFSVL